MTAEEHRAHHVRLHAALDDMVVCYVQQEGLRHMVENRSGILSGTSLLEFMTWSARMCTEAEGDTHASAP